MGQGQQQKTKPFTFSHNLIKLKNDVSMYHLIFSVQEIVVVERSAYIYVISGFQIRFLQKIILGIPFLLKFLVSILCFWNFPPPSKMMT